MRREGGSQEGQKTSLGESGISEVQDMALQPLSMTNSPDFNGFCSKPHIFAKVINYETRCVSNNRARGSSGCCANHLPELAG